MPGCARESRKDEIEIASAPDELLKAAARRARGTGWNAYEAALDTALDAIKGYAPDALVVSLGVDTFEDDPISAFKLESRHYPLMGERIAALGLPTVLVQEGGYAVAEIGTNVVGVLGAFAD